MNKNEELSEFDKAYIEHLEREADEYVKQLDEDNIAKLIKEHGEYRERVERINKEFDARIEHLEEMRQEQLAPFFLIRNLDGSTTTLEIPGALPSLDGDYELNFRADYYDKEKSYGNYVGTISLPCNIIELTRVLIAAMEREYVGALRDLLNLEVKVDRIRVTLEYPEPNIFYIRL